MDSIDQESRKIGPERIVAVGRSEFFGSLVVFRNFSDLQRNPYVERLQEGAVECPGSRDFNLQETVKRDSHARVESCLEIELFGVGLDFVFEGSWC